MPLLSSVSVAPDIPVRHLYRQILREVSYLPPAFSSSIGRLVHDAFHRNRTRQTHAKKRTAHARAALRTLRAANHGHRPSMETLIHKGFARAGKRRREILSGFVLSQGPSDSAALEGILDAETPTDGVTTKRREKHRFLQKWDKEKLKQLLKSQERQQETFEIIKKMTGGGIRNTNERAYVPKGTTIWGKPPGKHIVQKKIAGWWKRSADKILPPLGKGEWELLGLLSEGAQDTGEWRIPSRRTRATPILESRSKAEDVGVRAWKWQAYADHPVAFVEPPKSVLERQADGTSDETPYLGSSNKGISKRWFRRAYNRTWLSTPHMEQNPNNLKQTIQWGTYVERPVTATARQLKVFDGVDHEGKKIQQDQS